MTFQPSQYQMDILNWVVRGQGSCVVIAVAGAGKTKTIELSLPLIPEQCHVQLFSFNSTIAKELNSRVEQLRTSSGRAYRNLRASTFHSVGFGAICRYLRKKPDQMRTDAKKCRELVRGWLSDMDAAMYGDFICKLVGFAKGEGIGALAPDTDERWAGLIRHHDIYLEHEDADEETAISLARELLQLSNKAAKDGFIDFDDQLYLPLLWRLRLWQNDWVFVDEAQDTNPVRRALARLAMKPTGRLMAVGDPKQAIYGFTGASHDAIEIIKREFRAIELPLTVSYRCARSVVELAQTIVPYIEAHDGAPEGKVEDIKFADALKVLGPHDAIICRNTAPLMATAYHLIANGVGCVILGREIGAGLVNLIKKMKAKTITTLEEKLLAYKEREVTKLMRTGEEQKAEAVSDRVDCVLTVIEHLDEQSRTIATLIGRIEALFSDSNGVLTLCTGHKAKGKEWQRVAVLRPDLMPSKWARQDHQVAQEHHLRYVTYTRAMEHLMFLSDAPGEKK